MRWNEIGTKNAANDRLMGKEPEQLEKVIMKCIHIERYTIMKIYDVTHQYLVDCCVGEAVYSYTKKETYC